MQLDVNNIVIYLQFFSTTAAIAPPHQASLSLLIKACMNYKK